MCMPFDYTKVTSRYDMKWSHMLCEKIKGDLFYRTTEEVVGYDIPIKEVVDFMETFVTDRVKIIHFTEQKIHKCKPFDMVTFKIKFLGDNWEDLGIIPIEVHTDLKYGYSFLGSMSREKFANISVCVKKLS